MKKPTILLVLVLLLSLVPLSYSEPWIEIYTGKVKIGESLIVGEYKIKITQEETTLNPYAIIYKGDNIIAVGSLTFGNQVEGENVRITAGRSDGKEVFVVIQYKPELIKEIKPKAGESFNIDGYIVEILDATNESVSLKIKGIKNTTLTIKEGYSVNYDKLAFEYTDGILKAYLAKVGIKREETKDYQIYYPFESLKVEAGKSVQIPITVINEGNQDLILSLKILSMPNNWEARILDSQTNYEVSKVTVRAGSSVNFILFAKIPENAEGINKVKFAIGEEIGEITFNVLKKEEIDVRIPVLAIESEAGQVVNFPITLINFGEEKSVEVKILEKPENWEAYFVLNGQRVKSFSLLTQETLTLVIETPRNADLGEHKIEFSVNGINYSVSVFIYKTHKGEKATLTLRIVDDESKPVPNAKVTVGNEEYITDSQGSLELKLNLGDYIIEVEKEGYEKTKEEISLLDGEEKSLTIRLNRASYYFKAEIESDHLTIQFGSQLSYEVRIVNLGKLEDGYQLELSGLPSDWAYMFLRDPQSNIQAQSVKLGSGETKAVYLRIIPSYNAQPGTYNATLIITSASGLKYEKKLEVELIGSYEMDIMLQNYYVPVQAGKEISIPVTLRNLGSAPITNINFEVSVPEGWEVEVVPSRIAKLEPSYSREGKMVVIGSGGERVTLNIKVPETTPAGEYKVTIRAKGDQAERETELRVRVRQSSSSAYLGILILILAFGGLIFMMRRIGRR